MAQAVDDSLKRIQSHKGVIGTIVVNKEGIPVRSTLGEKATVQYAGLMSRLADKARSAVREIDPSNDLKFLRSYKNRQNNGTRTIVIPHDCDDSGA